MCADFGDWHMRAETLEQHIHLENLMVVAALTSGENALALIEEVPQAHLGGRLIEPTEYLLLYLSHDKNIA